LTTPVKAISPKVREINGTEGALSAPLLAGALVLASGVTVTAEAGSAKEAAMPPVTASTAEALVTGLAARETAADREAAGFRRPGDL